jgi:hypothetical protein
MVVIDITFILIYGDDNTGKSVQCTNICEMAEKALYVSLEVKNRKLLKDVSFDVTEALVIDPTNKIDAVPTFNKLGGIIEKIMKDNEHDTVVIDGISDLHRWAEKVVIAELKKKDPARKVIGKDDKQAWSVRNNLAYLPMERMSVWAEVNDRVVLVTSLLTDEYLGEKKIGRCVDAKDRLRKTADVRVQLINDGRGHLARFEKMPGWATEGPMEMVIGKGGLAVEFAKRGVI